MPTDEGLVAILEGMLEDPGYRTLAASLFPDARTAPEIAGVAAGIARAAFGREPARWFRVEMSVGATFGLELDDGRRIAVKLHLPTADARGLRAVSEVQRHLAAHGFPCPEVPREPLFDGVRMTRFEVWRVEGVEREVVRDSTRAGLGALLSHLVRLAARCPAHTELSREDWPASLWPTPHNSLFDFGRTAKGAEWIDDRARACRSIVDRVPSPTVAGHLDWSLQHFRFHADDSVAVVYDWDSLRLTSEVRLVGSAAACHTLRNDPVPTSPPTPGEARAFVRAYERHRGAPFNPSELGAVSAAALYAIAYGARCEHALEDPGQVRLREHLRGLGARGYFETAS